MKLKFRYELFILLSGTFIAADHVRAVDPDPSYRVSSELFIKCPDDCCQPINGNNVLKIIFLKDNIKELQRFSCEHILVLLENQNLKKTEAILYCLNTYYKSSEIVETKPIMQLLHLPLDVVHKIIYSDPQHHRSFFKLNDDEFNEFKKLSIDRMRTLIDYSKILPDILKFGLEKVRNLPDDEFNTLINRTLDQVEQLR